MNRDEKGGAKAIITEREKLVTSTITEEREESELLPTSKHHAHVEQNPIVKVLIRVIDVILAASPLIFVAIICTAIAYDGKPQNKENIVEEFDISLGQVVQKEATGFDKFRTARGGNAVIAAAAVAVSIFPILFAAIVGRFLKSYSMYRAERGASMAMLEQFYGSQNLLNAVQLTYALRGSGIAGFGVIILWILSPIGGQATQRVLYRTTATNSSAGIVYYADTASNKGAWNNHFDVIPRLDRIQALLSAALVSDSMMNPDVDVYNNPRIPFLETLDTTNYNAAKVENGTVWVRVGDVGESSSMSGLIINNMTNLTSFSFNVKSSYLSLTCEEPKTWNFSSVCTSLKGSENVTVPSDEQFRPYYDFLTWANLVSPLRNGSAATLTAPEPSVDNTTSTNPIWKAPGFNIGVETNGTSNFNGVDMPTFSNPPTFVYSASSRDGCIMSAYKCPSKVVWVESNIHCVSGQCTVRSMRNSTRPKDVEIDGIFDQDLMRDGGHRIGLALMLSSLNSFYRTDVLSRVVHPIEAYVSGLFTNPFGNLVPTDDADDAVEATKNVYPEYASKVSADMMSGNLASLLNTYWLNSLQSTAADQAPNTNSTLILESLKNSTTYGNSTGLGYDVLSVNTTFNTIKDVYEVNWPLAIVAMVISLMLIVFGFVGIYLRSKTSYPDILGFVSTLTRENPHFTPPADASKSSGLDMAAYYKQMRVKIVSTGDDDGRLTLRPVRSDAT